MCAVSTCVVTSHVRPPCGDYVTQGNLAHFTCSPPDIGAEQATQSLRDAMLEGLLLVQSYASQPEVVPKGMNHAVCVS